MRQKEESSEKCLFVPTYHDYLRLNVNLQATADIQQGLDSPQVISVNTVKCME